ncbi:dynein axonemal heavy chain 12-like [Corticium candelabrum]|uniref:dynein axonemal heavy chain 12-like n=1 Tax=Corticium candelabrum TaxID=121492 RepID=UPI002E26DB62|nr:dynein axonemal heavy chain 12-like [Corticium candelabrum]
MSENIVSSYTGLYALTWMKSASRLLAARRVPPRQFLSPQHWGLEGRQFLVLEFQALDDFDIPKIDRYRNGILRRMTRDIQQSLCIVVIGFQLVSAAFQITPDLNSLLEVEEYWREFFKILKVFQQQQKAKDKERGPKSIRRNVAQSGTDEDEEAGSVAAMRICNTVQDQIKEFKAHLPVISTLCNPGIRPRHWQKMSEIIGFDMTPDMGTSLRKVLKYDLAPHMEKFESISAGASKEFSLEKAMQKMELDWESIQFTTLSYRDTGFSILGQPDEIQTTLDDQIVKTQTMRGSPFIKPFEAQIKAWEERLLGMQDTIDEWLKCKETVKSGLQYERYCKTENSGRDIVASHLEYD